MHITEGSVNEAATAPAEPDQHWAKELAARGEEAEKATAYHQTELERWQRMARAVRAAHAELTNQPPQPEQSVGW